MQNQKLGDAINESLSFDLYALPLCVTSQTRTCGPVDWQMLAGFTGRQHLFCGGIPNFAGAV
jgi:hypothetical protein